MKTKFHFHPTSFIGLTLLVVFMLTGAFQLFSQTFDRDYQDGRLYFKYKDDVNVNFSVRANNEVAIQEVPFVAALQQDYRINKLERPFDINNDSKLLRTLMIEIQDMEKIDEVLARLKQQPELEYVEKVPMDYITYVPNDSIYNMFNGASNWGWHLDVIQADKAWDISKGSTDIKVAIVDNAVWADHPDLASKIVLQRDVYYNTNFSSPPATGDPFEWSHGTHCAGLAAAITDNEIGIASIGFNVSIIAIKAANNTAPNGIPSGYAGIQYAANNGADVINMSWGGPGYSATNQNLINSIDAMGIVLVAAAGNDNVSTAHYPSAYNNVISVAATDSDDTKAWFSNFGTTVDVSAPGGSGIPGPGGLMSTTFNQNTYGYYDLMSGTSMASPVAAGLAGLILSINPDLTPDQVEAIMKDNTDNIDEINPGHVGLLGTGRINAFRSAANTPYQPVADLSTPITTILPGTAIDFDDLSIGVPSTWTWTFEGGTPVSSSAPDPIGISYNTAGIYDVTLVVTNEFGSSTIIMEDYITVTATPKPYTNFSVSDSVPCIQDPITLNDLSLYEPTSWEWNITPAYFEFVNGTSSSSQNPEVLFSVPGYYSIQLAATNANGSTSMIIADLVDVYGASPSYTVDMEDTTSGYFELQDTLKSQIAVDRRAAFNSNYGLHFHGHPVPTGWSGSPTSGTAVQAWETNVAFHAKANICSVDGTGLDNIALIFDMRQTYSLGPRFSWFRVLINGEQIADENGVMDFNPETASDDEWKRLTFDLSAYAGTFFDITLQSAARFADRGQGEGDNVFVDNISITNTTRTKPAAETSVADFRVYPNPSEGVFTIASDKIEGNYNLKVLSLLGNEVYSFAGIANGKLYKAVNLGQLPSGIYLLSILGYNQQFNQRIIIR
jgi:subtilisin family serine protease